MGWYGVVSSVVGQGPATGSCEHGDEHSVFIKCWATPE
jgi:hypothetical protein